ncbi:hypothetical protein JJB07_11775 [Tumebacillus sp. ITR2]|uniref:Uncharacterized protein n=1 Tax=Tumebacillus amylolyticus TaxID=2801339 RepID=A0ABS1JAM4_9BACL|nr:hypothetical protein [Tumebacillus amylolyticus]MBL0387331.1 hypothetical protein [Tumebacillus amylolyticus]
MTGTERRLTVERMVQDLPGRGEVLRLDDLIHSLHQGVQVVRNEQPELRDYHLYDLQFSFVEQGLRLQIEFRK